MLSWKWGSRSLLRSSLLSVRTQPSIGLIAVPYREPATGASPAGAAAGGGCASRRKKGTDIRVFRQKDARSTIPIYFGRENLM
eukprot:2717847-Prymnesium_polylepis.1